MEDVPVRRLSGNALNYAAATATVKRNGFSDCIVLYNILLIYFILFLAGFGTTAHFMQYFKIELFVFKSRVALKQYLCVVKYHVAEF